MCLRSAFRASAPGQAGGCATGEQRQLKQLLKCQRRWSWSGAGTALQRRVRGGAERLGLAAKCGISLDLHNSQSLVGSQLSVVLLPAPAGRARWGTHSPKALGYYQAP